MSASPLNVSIQSLLAPEASHLLFHLVPLLSSINHYLPPSLPLHLSVLFAPPLPVSPSPRLPALWLSAWLPVSLTSSVCVPRLPARSAQRVQGILHASAPHKQGGKKEKQHSAVNKWCLPSVPRESLPSVIKLILSGAWWLCTQPHFPPIYSSTKLAPSGKAFRLPAPKSCKRNVQILFQPSFCPAYEHDSSKLFL